MSSEGTGDILGLPAWAPGPGPSYALEQGKCLWEKAAEKVHLVSLPAPSG